MDHRSQLTPADQTVLVRAAAFLGIPSNPDPSSVLPLTGEVEGFSIALGAWAQSRDARGFLVTVTLPRPFPHAVSFRPTLLGRSADLFERVLSADRNLDARISIHGDPAIIRGLLSAPARQALLGLAEVAAPEAIELVDDALSMQLGLELDDQDLVAAVQHLLAFAKYACDSRNVLQRLLHNTVRDSDKAVRESNGELLLRLLDRGEISGRARLAAYRAVAESTTPPMRHRVQALHRMRTFPRDEVLPTMERLFSESSPHLRRVIIDYFGEVGHAPSVPLIVGAIDALDDHLAVRAARALARIGDPAGEPTMIRLLERPSIEVRLAAADGLGAFGSADAIRPLKETARVMGWGDRGVFLRAVEAIEARTGAGVGQLSIAGVASSAGDLSLAAQAGPGAVSIGPGLDDEDDGDGSPE